MNKMNTNKEYNLNQDQISVKTSTVVRLNEYFTLMTLEGPVDFKVEINADFVDIPEKYHEVVLNMLTSKYTNKVSFGHNPFSQCSPPVKRKWWQFWKKSKYFLQ
jgi:hypothetical protein